MITLPKLASIACVILIIKQADAIPAGFENNGINLSDKTPFYVDAGL